MMSRHVDLVHSFLPLVSIATFWCVVRAKSDIDGPSNTSLVNCNQGQCVRYWWTSMWGFIITLIALTMDAWGALKSKSESTIRVFSLAFLIGALNPLDVLWDMLKHMVKGMAMLANLCEALGDHVIAPYYPWSKSHIKIIVGSNVFVNLSSNVHKEIFHRYDFLHEVQDKDFSEALVIGLEVVGSEQFIVQLSPHGQLALLRSDVLPPYDELKFLRGHSSLGMAIASAQATGYIYGIVIRCAQGLRVSPIEAIACILNVVIFMKGVLHMFASLGHRPLLFYLRPQEEAKFVVQCINIQNFKFQTPSRLKVASSIPYGVLLGIGSYFIYNFLSKSLSKTCIVPILLLEVSLISGGIQALAEHLYYSVFLNVSLVFVIVLLNIVGYIWALVVTFKYWKGEEFDVRSSNYLSEVLPYIG